MGDGGDEWRIADVVLAILRAEAQPIPLARLSTQLLLQSELAREHIGTKYTRGMEGFRGFLGCSALKEAVELVHTDAGVRARLKASDHAEARKRGGEESATTRDTKERDAQRERMLRDEEEEGRKWKAERKVAKMLRRQEEQEARLKMEPAKDEATSKRRGAQNEACVQPNTEVEAHSLVAADATGNHNDPTVCNAAALSTEAQEQQTEEDERVTLQEDARSICFAADAAAQQAAKEEACAHAHVAAEQEADAVRPAAEAAAQKAAEVEARARTHIAAEQAADAKAEAAHIDAVDRKKRQDAEAQQREVHLVAGDATAAVVAGRVGMGDVEGARAACSKAADEWAAAGMGKKTLKKKLSALDLEIDAEGAKLQAPVAYAHEPPDPAPALPAPELTPAAATTAAHATDGSVVGRRRVVGEKGQNEAETAGGERGRVREVLRFKVGDVVLCNLVEDAPKKKGKAKRDKNPMSSGWVRAVVVQQS